MRGMALSPVILVSLFASISVALVVLSLITQSWYLVDTTESDGDMMISISIETSERFGLSQEERYARLKEGPNTVLESTVIYGYGSMDDDEVSLADYEQVARITLFLMVAGAVISCLYIAFTIVYRRGLFDGDERAWRYVPVIIGSIGIVLIVSAIAYFIIAFPGTVTDQEGNSEEFSQDSSVGFSFILAVAATVPILISVILMYRTTNPFGRSPA